MKSAARLGESAPSTSTPSTGVDTGSAGDCCTLMRGTLGEGADGPAYRPNRVPDPAARAVGCGRIASRRVRPRSRPLRRRPLAPRGRVPPAPARHLPGGQHRGQRRPGVLLVVPGRRADRDHAGAHRGERAARAGARQVPRRPRVRRDPLPLGAAPRGLARDRGTALRLRRQLDHAPLPRGDDLDRRGGPTPARGVLDRGRRADHLAAGGRRRLPAVVAHPDPGCSAWRWPSWPARTCSSACSTSCRACRWTAAGCSRPGCGRRPATCTAARSSPAGAAGWPRGLVLLWPMAQVRLLGPGNEPDLLDFVLAFVVAMFLWQGSTAAIVSGRVRRRLPGLVARDLARRTLAVPDDLPLAEAVRRAQEAAGGRDRDRGRQRHARSGWSTRPRCWPPPWTGGRGSR